MSARNPYDRYKDQEQGVTTNLCAYCAHSGPLSTCTAFPEHIPNDILANRADHRRPVEGDHGIRFEPRPDVDPDALQRLYRVLDALN